MLIFSGFNYLIAIRVGRREAKIKWNSTYDGRFLRKTRQDTRHMTCLMKKCVTDDSPLWSLVLDDEAQPTHFEYLEKSRKIILTYTLHYIYVPTNLLIPRTISIATYTYPQTQK
jgi:hypothetical protein